MDEARGVPRWIAIASPVLISALALLALYLSRRAPPVPAPVVAPMFQPTGPAIQLWLSTQDRRLRLARQADVPITDAGSAPADLVIDTGRTYQSIVGFGAALTDSSAWLLQNRLSAPVRRALLHELFGPPPGLGFNMIRLTIGASDFSLQPYTLDDMPAGDVDPDLEHFNVAANLRDLIPTVNEVLSIDPHLRIIASPWSAPAWMKTSANLIGGTLLEQYESTYAQYLVKYVDTYRSYGIPIFALTLQNEPGFVPVTYPGMLLSAEQRVRIIAQYLGPALSGRRPVTRILEWDHNWDEPQQPLSVLSDADAARYINGVAWHCYRGTPGSQTEVHRAFPRKDAYITECSGGDWESSKHGELLWFARDLLLGGLRNWARGVVYWNLALDEHYGPHFGGCDTCKGIVTIDSRSGAVSRNDEYYAFAHYSRFIQPGAVRIWSTDTGNDIKNVAFRNPSGGSIVLVLINGRTEAHEVSVQQDDIHFRYNMPAESVATFVWNPGRADEDSDAASPEPARAVPAAAGTSAAIGEPTRPE